ncbi:uncharacterized protein Z520_07662 [Fonsecaea multimorphosa CBS 102226]|uniref:F-box domain-containing protein n=1 Tax=Fonsecaea multimorphosa CBS 102226 TaxID=1442371 RepID=A0A0D2IH75_9EURO|nr:uncharacterized protein Z520_07662 [Fonsecaea multimorphosa CBS 102226]KIX96396.1 hypothetical protein Z520_07662 [Fonsecaea multimorphosa CBS 102226]OAL22308.1 hypothetical protein AYO22_07352 [Fonsecaea multimorphosa]
MSKEFRRRSSLPTSPSPWLSADIPVQELCRKPHQSTSFLSLPSEIRLKIYGFVCPEIEIDCRTLFRPSANPTTERFICKTTHRIHLLLTSRKVYAEAKPVFDSAPVAVACRLYIYPPQPLIPLDFPQSALPRVYKLNVAAAPQPYFGGLGLAFGHNWLDRNICPNVRVICRAWPKIEPLSYKSHRFSIEKESPLHFIPLLLPGSPIDPRDYGITNGNIHNLFEVCKSRGANDCWRNFVVRENAWITHHDLTVKTTYRIGLRARTQEVTNCMGPWIVFESWLDVVVIRDKNGIRIDGLPDLRASAWWKEWTDSFQLPPSQQLVILETCTEFPERAIDSDRPWNIVRSSLESVEEN